MPIKDAKMFFFFSKNKNMRYFLISQGSLNPKIRFLGQKVCRVARAQTDRLTTEGILSGFQDFSFNLSSSIGPVLQDLYIIRITSLNPAGSNLKLIVPVHK